MDTHSADKLLLFYKSMKPADRAKAFGYNGDQGYVYFIEGGKLIKVGFTSNLDERIAFLGLMSPVGLRYIGGKPGTRKLKNFLHALFDADRQHGEWFKPSDLLLELANAEDFGQAIEDLIENRLEINVLVA